MAGRIGYGVTVSVGSAIGEVTSIGIGGAMCDAVDVTYLAMSTAYRPFVAGLGTGDVVTIEANWVGAQYASVRGLLRTTSDVVVTVGSVTYTWEDALITKVGSMTVTTPDVMKFSFEIQTMGPPTIG